MLNLVGERLKFMDGMVVVLVVVLLCIYYVYMSGINLLFGLVFVGLVGFI